MAFFGRELKSPLPLSRLYLIEKIAPSEYNNIVISGIDLET
jgi:hypothetical protein